MEKCKICENIVTFEGKTVNRHIYIHTDNDQEVLCIDCADGYFADLDIKRYKKWCKDRNKKVDPNVIEQIINNEI